jgi:hypothetical protein
VTYSESFELEEECRGIGQSDLPESRLLRPIFLQIAIGDFVESRAVILCS